MKLSKRLLIRYIRTKFKLLAAVSKRRAAQEAFILFCTPLGRAKRKYPTSLKNAEDLEIKVEGLRLYGNRWNHPAKKKALIVHGFSSASHNFERYVSPLIQKGYEVVAFDAPAHGRSEGLTVNVVQYSSMIMELVDQYGPFQAYISHSFGGLAITLTLENIPHYETDKLVLIAPATETTSAIDGAFKLLQLNDHAVRQEFNKVIFDIGGQWPEWYSVIRALKNVKAQVLWIHDKDDDVTPYHDASKVIEGNLTNLNFITTKGLGHSKIYRDNEIVKTVTDFL